MGRDVGYSYVYLRLLPSQFRLLSATLHLCVCLSPVCDDGAPSTLDLTLMMSDPVITVSDDVQSDAWIGACISL